MLFFEYLHDKQQNRGKVQYCQKNALITFNAIDKYFTFTKFF